MDILKPLKINILTMRRRRNHFLNRNVSPNYWIIEVIFKLNFNKYKVFYYQLINKFKTLIIIIKDYKIKILNFI